MREIGLLSVDSTAANWRDLSPADQKKEKAFRIACAVAAIATVTGFAILSIKLSDPYFLCMGLISAGIAGGFSLFANYEGGKFGLDPDFSKKEILEQHIQYLMHQDLLSLYVYYRNGDSGGLRPLVRHGILSADEGTKLKRLFNQCTVLLNRYGDLQFHVWQDDSLRPLAGATFQLLFNAALHSGCPGTRHNEEMKLLSHRWEIIQKGIQKRFDLKQNVPEWKIIQQDIHSRSDSNPGTVIGIAG